MNSFLDERGHDCPIPVINTKHALKELKKGDVLTVKVDKNVKMVNVKEAAIDKGHKVETKINSDNDIDVIITVEKDGENSIEKNTCECGCTNEKKENSEKMVVVISSNKMGCGDELLGKNLMKAFIFSLTKQEKLPDVVLFYNSGAYLTCEESESINDLKAMEESGVEIFTCGTCLEFYNLKEKLQVGKVTNMYDIVEKMEKATKILRP